MPESFTQSITFSIDGLKLCGVLHLPVCTPKALIVGCHGLMADKSSPKQLALARRCVAWGAAYFRFDHRGCGTSEGLFEEDTTIENRVRDLIAAVAAATHTLGKTLPTGLFGSSLGGTVCLIASSHISPFATVTLATPVRSKSIHVPENIPEPLKNEIFRGRLRFNLTAQLTSLDHILIVHGSADETVAVENAHWIYAHAKEPKTELILENCDHRISDTNHQKRFLQAATQWFSDCYFGRLADSR